MLHSHMSSSHVHAKVHCAVSVVKMNLYVTLMSSSTCASLGALDTCISCGSRPCGLMAQRLDRSFCAGLKLILIQLNFCV